MYKKKVLFSYETLDKSLEESSSSIYIFSPIKSLKMFSVTDV